MIDRSAWQMLTELVPVLLLAAAGVGVLWVSRRGPRVVGGDACCSRCGYLVRGLPGPICPECGSDLREPGAVATAGGRRPPGKWRLALGWSAFSVFTVWVGFTFLWRTFILERLPYLRDVRQDYTLANPASGAYDRIQIRSHARGTTRLGKPDPAPTLVTLQLSTSAGSRFDLDVDTKTLGYQYATRDGARKRGMPLNETALLAWLHDMGVRGDQTQLSAEMDIVLGDVRALQQNAQLGWQSVYPAFSSSASRGSLSTSPLPHVHQVPMALGLLVWVIGIAFIIFRKAARGERPHAVANGFIR